MKEEPIAENDSLRFKEGGGRGGGTRLNTPAALSSREMTQMLSAKHEGFGHGESTNPFVQRVTRSQIIQNMFQNTF